MNNLIDLGNLFVKGYLPFIRKNFISHMRGLAVYLKEGLPFTEELPLEDSVDSYLGIRLALFRSVSYFFFFY